VHDLEQRGVQLFARLQRITPVGEQASRSSAGATYSFCWRSDRGITKPVRLRRANSVRKACTRGALAVGSGASSNDWNFASNMAAIY
jgi:hypothetical protein